MAVQGGRDITVKGSSAAADDTIDITTGRDVSITAAQTRLGQGSFREEKSRGLLSSGGGVTLGSQQHSTNQQSQGTGAAASTVGAISGNVNITAGRTYTQTGSDVLAPGSAAAGQTGGGNITVQAQSIAITEARTTERSTSEQKFKQSGVSIGLGGALVEAAQGAVQMVESMGQTQDSRMQALGAATAALQGYNAMQSLSAPASGGVSSAGVSVNISLGASKSQSNSESQRNGAQGSTIVAGGDITLSASGAGERSDILVQGSRVKAGQVATLSAEGDVDLLAATNTTQESSRSKSSSASVGFSLGAKTGVTVAASAGKGHGSGQETVHSNTRIEAGEQVRIDSGGNTTLRGAVVAAPRVQARVQGELLIESLQDTSVFHEQSKQGGGSVTFGPTPGATVSAGKTKIDSNLASVGEQSAIRAGDAGFDVQVKGATDLKGGAVTSTQAAIDQGLNTFDSADGLTTSDIHNTASFSAKSSGVTVGVGSQLGSSGAGIGSDQGSASSTTQAAISGIAGNTAARTGDAETGIAPIFDKDRVRDEVEAQVAITKAFGQQAVPAWRDYANQQFEEAVKSGDEESANCWGPDGGCRAAGHALIGGLTGDVGGAAGAAASSMAAPHVQSFLMDQGLPKEAAQALTQLSALGAGAAAGNSAGAAAGLNESAHNAVVAIPLLVEGVVAGGAIAARACLSSPACLNALRLTGATLVAKVASMLDPDDLALIPGFGTAIPDPAGSNTASPAFPQAGSSSTTTPGSVLTNSGTPPREVSGYAPGSNTTISPSDTEAAGSVIVMNSNGQDLSVRLPSLVDAKGAIHILVGDKPGSGGHLWPGQPGKTPFPQSWDADTVLGVVSDVATDPASIREPAQGGRFIVRGTRNGVIVEVIIESPSRGGRIVTGYPTNLPRNTK